MTSLPSLYEKNTEYALQMLGRIAKETNDRRAGSKGEREATQIILGEAGRFCDEVTEQTFSTHPGVGTVIQKALGILLILCVVLFSVSVRTGAALPAALSALLNLIIFGAYAHKLIFNGTTLDFLCPKKSSSNVFGRRFSSGEAERRIVITSHIDSPLCLRSVSSGDITLNLLFLLCVIGNTLLFCFQLVFLFSGAPSNNTLFNILNIIAILFVPVYIFSVFITDPRRTASGVSSGLVPSCISLGIMKQLSEEGVRYSTTEVCFLFTGSEHSGRAGSYAFARKHRRLFSDIPTVFISLDKITSTDKLCVYSRDGSGHIGSQTDAAVITQAAENLEIPLTNELPLIGSRSFTPFSENRFRAISVGSSKRLTSKTTSAVSDRLSDVRQKTIEDMGALLLEALNYYDN